MPAGTIVASGSLVSPGGQQGIPGQVGPSAVAGLLTLSSAYTFTSADSGKYAICSGGSWALGLPAPVLGMAYRVRNDQGITGTTGTITITPASGTIDGAATLPLLAGQEVLIITDGSNWRTFGRQRTVVVGTRSISAATASDTFLLPPGYSFYEFDFDPVVGSADGGVLQLILSADGGNTWITTGIYSLAYMYTSSSTAAASSTNSSAANAIASGAVTFSGASNGIALQTYVKFWPGNGARNPNWKYEGWGWNGTYENGQCGAGRLSSTSIINAVKYQMSSGNIILSNLTVKGII